MSVGDGVEPKRVVSGADITSPPVAFRVTVYATGQMEWKMTPTGDAMTDELLLRGWLDKVRETILDRIRSGGRIVT